MSLRGFSRRKLFCHSCYCKYTGTFQPQYMIFQSDRYRSLDRCFIRTPSFPSNRSGVRLLSFSLNKFNILSRLTSFFTQKKTEDVSKKTLAEPVYASDSSQNVESFSDHLNKNKLISLINKLPTTSPYDMSIPINTALKPQSAEENMKKRDNFHQDILKSTETFLQQYNKDLDRILKKSSISSSKKRSKRLENICKETKIPDKTDIFKKIKYPVVKVNKRAALITPQFEETKQFLQSLNIPCDELHIYPRVQQLSKEEILNCVKKLKEINIHSIFCLYLIEHICVEQERRIKDLTAKRKPFRLPLTSFLQVKAYQQLCQSLDIPDLNIRNLLERLAEIGLYFDILELSKKVKKLRDVGADPEDILSNLDVLQGYEFFYEKIELYKKSSYIGIGTFPMHLFLCKTMASFKDLLAVGGEIDKITRLLDVSVAEFQECWGFKRYNSNQLQYKVSMCLTAGISKKDIFNNLGALMVFPIEQCHAVTSCFRNSGMPASVFVLRAMVGAAELNGNGNTKNICDGNKDQNCATTVEDDWIGESKTLVQKKAPSNVKPKRIQKFRIKEMELSTKKQRRANFSLIERLLNLNKYMITALHQSHVNISNVELLDIPKNLEYLTSLNFTKQHIAMCPLILAHPHVALVRIVSTAESLTRKQLQSTMSISPQELHLFSSSSSSSENVEDKYKLVHLLCTDPLQRLNVYQYHLEKESSFSLASIDSERASAALNV